MTDDLTVAKALSRLADKLHFWCLDLEEFQKHIRLVMQKDPSAALRLGGVMGGGLILTRAIRGFLELLSEALEVEDRRGLG